ncbi:hypothetical protein [Bordetella sp. BOR01]|uniref:hypothetical protein n=1 Tax=Bordetella sp. BOR01 TaxID=2854779 RepID=UPI001C494136|nr:hypothetical protein [Bordetella sp. BOR01]MBV7483151.1 hypothetical protein [Bordetella sp. BOR01]
MSALSDEDLPAWALHAARCAGLGQAVHQHPDQVVRAAAAARNTLKALQDDMSGIAQLSRPTWGLSK